MNFFGKKYIRRVTALIAAFAVILTYYCAVVSAVDVYKGDFDGNGRITSSDARGILRIAARLDSQSDDVMFICDANSDGSVNTADARLTLRIAAKLDMPVTVTSSETASSTVTTDPNLVDISSPSETLPVIPITSQLPVPNTTSVFTPVDNIGIPKPNYPAVPAYNAMPDSFVFICYGYGHGVGLSQYGAVGMARNGYNYAQILAHYFPGISIVREVIPCNTSVLHTGEKVGTFELLCRVVQQEIAGITKSTDIEALKAQAVAAYTTLKAHKFSLPNKYTMAYSSSMTSVKSEVIAAVNAVLGEYATYNGELISTPFFAYSAGVTTDASTVWGSSLPYLRPVTSYCDIEVDKYSGYRSLITVRVFSAEEIKQYIKSYDSSINLPEDHSKWLQVLAHDCAVSDEIGYVSAMRIGDRVIDRCAGQTFRMNIMDLDIDSHCFSLLYYDNSLGVHSCNAVTYR